ncbi:MAG: hypothetical protein HY067_21540 [Betaproteobacteria bacterium]|nr:hypothetical protein [Betaproteobacteria bacterium]
MKNVQYLDEMTALLREARPRLAATHRLEFKNCFGAVTGYINGKIFISCGSFGTALRLPPKVLDVLFKDSDVRPLKYFPNGHVKKAYAVLPRRITGDKQRFKKLLEESIKHSSSK